MRSLPPAASAERASVPPGAARAETIVATAAGERPGEPRSQDVELVDALATGAPWAAEEVWGRHAGDVRRLMVRALGPRPEVEDLTQEVFMRVFSRIGLLRDAR